MKKITLFLLLFCLTNAKDIVATYDISFGIFGQIGTAKAIFKIDKNSTYSISIKATATGLAKILSGGRIESYDSTGRVVNGVLVPDIYKGVTKKRDKISTKIYYFLHKKREVDVLKIKLLKDKEIKSEDRLGYYTDNDILTLFFNIKRYLDGFKFVGHKKLYAIGANKKDGRVDIVVPKREKLEGLKRELGKKIGHFMKVFINQKIFASKKGELLLVLDDKGICTKAILKDVIFFGDIRGELVDLK